MRLHAYVLAADPAFLAASVRSYYDLVERIVVSYDAGGRSWTGGDVPVDDCLRTLKELDVEGKLDLAPGDFTRPGHDPLDSETRQRRVALARAGEGADWVLQLDTDEVMERPATFLGCLERAERAGAEALDYPSRWLYSRVGDAGPGRGSYLEGSTRWWRPAASYPGPLAVRSGTVLTLARQAAGARHYRVDLRPWSTDPHRPADAVVHEVVGADDAVLHFSWVRPDEVMRRKLAWSGHAAQYARPVVYQRWAARSRHPRRAVVATPLRRGPWLRLVRLDDPEPAWPGEGE